MAVFGSETHSYRYHKGKYPVTTRQQVRVAQLFAKYANGAAPQYDRMEGDYEFLPVGK